MKLVGKVRGHEIKTIKEKDAGGAAIEYDVMAVKMEFESQEGEKPSRALFLMAVDRARDDFQIGDAVNLDVEVRQQKLPLGQGASASRVKH